jgi:arginine N-succinyltransferase
MPPMTVVRPVHSDDAAALQALAEALDTVNLPADPAAIREIIARSEAGFAGDGAGRAQYTLVAEREGRLLGTASLFARHGTPEDPHYALAVEQRTVVSQQLHAGRERRVLRLVIDQEPWTELGGLVVAPAARGQGLGKMLVAARLLLIAMHRERFCARCIAELLPARDADGGNAFWEAVGRPLTGMDYQRADRLCRSGKEFIDAWFPHQELVVDLLPPAAQALIGVEGPATAPVRALLRRAGFRFLGTVDPFDAGPHDGAAVADILPIARSRRLVRLDHPPEGNPPDQLIATPDHRFALVPVGIHGDGARIPHELALGLRPGDPVWTMPWAW